jgi:hypothetical protein
VFRQQITLAEPSIGDSHSIDPDTGPPDPTDTAPTASKSSRATVKPSSGIINFDGIGGKTFTAESSGAAKMAGSPERSMV